MRALIVEDTVLLQEELRDLLEETPGVGEVEVAGDAAAARERLADDEGLDLVLLDLTLPRDRAEADRGETSLVGPELALEIRRRHPAARLVVVTGRRRDDAVGLLLSSVVDDFVSKDAPGKELRARVLEQVRGARAEAASRALAPAPRLVGSSPVMEELRARVERAAGLPAPVLVTGESGTGKEVVAWNLHSRGPRARGPFLPFHPSAIAESLLEAELFGHARGAFTGASAARAGVVEAARGGTLFLDEIGELPEAFQVKLLRFLDSGTYHRPGEDTPRRADVRLVFATNRDLAAEVEAGRFREDLLYRLDVLRIEVPPLRERGGDVGELAEHLVATLGARQGRPGARLAPGAAEALADHPWPGNVRELRNVVERALMTSADGVVDADALRASLPRRGARAPAPSTGTSPGAALYREGEDLKASMARLERELLEQALEAHEGNLTRTAESLGISRRGLQLKVRRLGLRRADRPPGP